MWRSMPTSGSGAKAGRFLFGSAWLVVGRKLWFVLFQELFFHVFSCYVCLKQPAFTVSCLFISFYFMFKRVKQLFLGDGSKGLTKLGPRAIR